MRDSHARMCLAKFKIDNFDVGKEKHFQKWIFRVEKILTNRKKGN